ncbi:tetratricopeptide repeat protein [Antribacter gilvus]|uniref:tetratricopeptide repeat protein n=1 Tax=Antribacter gilvus TaxID=2304675 RepID=UPI003B838FEA
MSNVTAADSATNPRTLVWLANLHAALGDNRRACHLLDRVTESQPENAYLTYRRAHVLAELGRPEEAVRALDDAVTQGFLSIQLAAAEKALALSVLVGRSDYRTVVRRLRHRVSTCATTYALDLPSAPVHQSPDLDGADT